jgi:uroporphyrinogen III methyltransferase/synthase
MCSSFNKAKLLQNKKIVIACSAKKMIELAAGLKEKGGDVFPFPVIEVKDIEDKHLLDNALESLPAYSWIIFTSAYGVRFFMQRMKKRGVPIDPQRMPKICAIGPATAREVRESGNEVLLMPEQYVAEGILAALESYHGGLRKLSGSRILMPRAKKARDFLPKALASAGAHVDVVPCYQTVRAEIDPNSVRTLRRKNPDLIVFTSSSTVINLMDVLGRQDGRRILSESVVAVLGPITAGTVASFGKLAEIVPKENTVASLIEAICDYYRIRQ